MEPIRIPRDVAEAAGMPEDLDAGNLAPYRFPDPRRRKTAAAIYLALGLVGLLALPGTERFLFAAATGLLALWHARSAWPLNVTPEEALGTASAAAPFPIGHASAAVTFHGWRARPRWHVILYDAASPPGRRALIVVDGVSGEVGDEPYIEDLVVADTGD